MLCTVPAFRALRQAFPEAHIALISLPWAVEFVAAYPDLFDEFISFPGWPGLPEQPLDPVRSVDFLKAMQARAWDVVVQMQGNGTLVNAMLSLFGARVLAGYYLPVVPSEFWVGETGVFVPHVERQHEIKRYAALMRALGLVVPDEALYFSVRDAHDTEAEALLHACGLADKPYALIHAGGISGRRWPARYFASVADTLARKGLSILLTGTAAEQPIVDEVRRQMRQPALSVAGQTSLGTLAALLRRATLLISNDTGVAHLAVACQTPSVVVYTSANPAEWGPLDRQRHRVVQENTPHALDEVIREANNILLFL